MRKQNSMLGIIILGLGVLLGWSRPAPGLQTVPINVQKIEPFAYFCVRVKGPFSQINDVIGKLTLEAQAQSAIPTGPLMAVYYNNPAEVGEKDLDWEVGFPVSPQQMIQPPLLLKTWDFTQVAGGLHQGPYEKAGETIDKILQWMDEHGYAPAGPVMERFLDMNPSELKPQDLRTEIWIPFKKKEG
jgi:effector-binding domain-containing protein